MNRIEALLTLLNQVDYESGACRINEPIGGVLPVEVLRLAKIAAQAPFIQELAAYDEELQVRHLPEGDCPFCVNNEPHLKEHCYREIRRKAKANGPRVKIDDVLMKAAIDKWGIDLQLDLAQEECSELILAIAHFRRGRKNADEKVIEEIADVKIMIRQLELMFSAVKVDMVIQQKMDRLAKRLELGVYESEGNHE